jgi:hypothetical protein
MSLDTTKIERIGPDYWRNSQLSIARHFGACILNNTRYILCPDTDYLVREDVWKRELKEKKKLAKVAKAEKKKWAQGEL